MSTAVPVFCCGCGARITSTWHSSCRPSQRNPQFPTNFSAEHADLLQRISDLLTIQTADHIELAARGRKIAQLEAMLEAEYDSPTPKTAGYQRWYKDLRERAGDDG